METRAIATLGEQQGQPPGGSCPAGTGVERRKRSRVTLRTLEDVAVELARLYRRAERGQIPTADASRLTYILTSLGKVLEAAVIEARLNALEEIANDKT